MELNTTFVENEMELDGDFGQVFEVSKSTFEGGAIQVCCACQTMITESTGKIIETKKSRINAGKPVVGQYALYSNGIALVESVADNGDFTATVMAYNRITINGEVSTTKTIYAPTNIGSQGQMLVSTGNVPVWRNVVVNGKGMQDGASIYAPTTFGTAGQMLVSNGQNKAPTWANVPESGGGSVEGAGEIQFCCFANVYSNATSIGSVQTVSKTDIVVGKPVVGQYAIVGSVFAEITKITDTNFSCTIKGMHNLRLNGVSTPLSTHFYAPKSSGTAGQVLVSQGSGKEPVWKNLSEIS